MLTDLMHAKVLAAGLLTMLASQVSAQIVGGELTGRIADSTGRLIGDMPVLVEQVPPCDNVRSDGTAACPQWTTRTGYQGAFYVAQLPAGTYRVTIPLGAFRPYERVVQIRRGLNEFLDVVLELRGTEQIVVAMPVSAVSSSPSPASGLVETTFTRAEIEALPLASGRNLQTFQGLVPGVVFTDSTGTLAEFTTLGQRRFSNRLTIDGMSADLAADVRGTGVAEAASGALPAAGVSGGSLAVVSLDAIDQIQIRTTNASPEYARSPGAQTAVVTRAGGDRLSGTAFTTIRPDAFVASTWFEAAGTAPSRRSALWNGGGSLGGPLVSQRIRYFATWEQQRIDRSVTSTISVPSQASRDAAPAHLRPVLDAFPKPNGPDGESGLAAYSGVFPSMARLWSFSARLDGTLSDRQQAFIRVHRSRSAGDQLTQPDQLPFLSHTRRESTSTTTATMALMSRLSGFGVNDARLNVTSHSGAIDALPSVLGGAMTLPLTMLGPGDPRETWSQVTLFPGPNGAVSGGRPMGIRHRQFQIIDTLSLATARHEWRLGADCGRRTTSSAGAADRYDYMFSGIEQFLRGRARLVTIQQMVPWDTTRVACAAFVQDVFRVRPTLSVEYGARYSRFSAPFARTPPALLAFEQLPARTLRPAGEKAWNSANRVAPRAQLVYRRESVQLRAGWSMVFDELASPGLAPFTDGYPLVATRVLIAPSFPVDPNELVAAPPDSMNAGDRSKYYAVPTNLRPPHVHQWQVGGDYELGPVRRLSLAYVGSAGRDLIYRHVFYGPGSSISSEAHAYSNDATLTYHALLAGFVGTVCCGVKVRASYAWSHSIDTDSGEMLGPLFPPTPQTPLSINRASADFDRRHVLQFNMNYRIPSLRDGWTMVRQAAADWHVDLVGTFRSGTPVALSQVQVFPSGAYLVRPDVVPGLPVWLPDAAGPTGRRLNEAAFRYSKDYRQGTLGRNSIAASPLRQIDLSLSRTLSFPGTTAVQLRFDVFNLFNVANFGPPVTVSGDDNFGRPSGTYADALGAGALALGGLTPLQQQGGPRAMQISVRVSR